MSPPGGNTEPVPFPAFMERFRAALHSAFHDQAEIDTLSTSRGLPPGVFREIMRADPLSACIPAAHGGRGGHIHEALSLLSAASYESLALGLTFGINWALFLQPVSKYGLEEVKAPIFRRFLHNNALGGLMITEPAFGTDALGMQTAYVEQDDRYRIRGTKHWGGLTGAADYWLVAARRRKTDGGLNRDIDFFICDQNIPGQEIAVEEYFESLGLYQIPYGRNHVDVEVPGAHRLRPESTGLKLMLDTLHRSRLQFPGMGQGFLQRMLDEALSHCRTRSVGGRSLFGYDQVQHRLTRLQASFTISSAMSLYTSEHAGVDKDLSDEGIAANTTKAVVTDLMQDASQSLLQLVGAQGYRLNHIAGRATVDSRPFQIFEGSNDVLYGQISELFLRLMRRVKETNLVAFLRGFHLTARAAGYFRKLLNFDVKRALPQRKMVDLGRVLSGVVSMEWVLQLGDRGFRKDLIANGVAVLRHEIEGLIGSLESPHTVSVVDAYGENSSWLSFLDSQRR